MGTKLNFVFLLIFTLFQSFRVDCFEFAVSRKLSSIKAIEKDSWSYVNVSGKCQPDEYVHFSVKIPVALTSDPFAAILFFANDIKNILKVELKEKVQGRFFSTPYDEYKIAEGPVTNNGKTANYATISGSFPSSWLPENCTKISAAVIAPDGTYYNYYGIQNSAISITDLMVVEEYKDYKCDL